MDAKEIKKVKDQAAKLGRSFIYRQDAENDEQQKNVVFVAELGGEEVLFDAFFYTLEMEFFSDIYEDAVAAVVEREPKFEGADFNALEGEHIEMMENIVDELSKDEDYQVQEFYDVDDTITEFGVALDVCLNKEEITEEVIEGFIKKFKANPEDVALDETFYSFTAE